jgi:hypothetical protein
MSSQGWASALEGLNKGLVQGLDIASNQQKLAMMRDEAAQRAKALALQTKTAQAGLAEKGIADVGPDGAIIKAPGFGGPTQDWYQARIDTERAAKQAPTSPEVNQMLGLPAGTKSIDKDLIPLYSEKMKNPDIFGAGNSGDQPQGLSALAPSQMGNGPTAIGSPSGLGSLAAPVNPQTGLRDRYAGGTLTADDMAGLARSEKGIQLLNGYRTKQNEDRTAAHAQEVFKNQRDEFDLKRGDSLSARSQAQTKDLLDRYEKDTSKDIISSLNTLDQNTGIISNPGNADLSKLPNSMLSRMEATGGITGGLASVIAPSFRSTEEQATASALQTIKNLVAHGLYGARLTSTEINALNASFAGAKPEVAAQVLRKIYDEAKGKIGSMESAFPGANVAVLAPTKDAISAIMTRAGGQTAEAAPPASGPVGSKNNPMVGKQNTHQPSLTPQEAAAELARRKSSRGN